MKKTCGINSSLSRVPCTSLMCIKGPPEVRHKGHIVTGERECADVEIQRQDKATEQNKAKQDKSKQGKARQTQDKTRQYKTRQVKTRQGMAKTKTNYTMEEKPNLEAINLFLLICSWVYIFSFSNGFTAT